jgi:hypothetical protein
VQLLTTWAFTHVSPSVDCDGVTADDFAEDPDFEEEYFDGAYDVPCAECRGEKVVPEMVREKVDPALLARLDVQADARARYRHERAMERRYGY